MVMRMEKKDPPRKYRVGPEQKVEISDCGHVYLEPDEQVTFVTKSGKQHDFAAKSWGFYATPSMNGRLAKEGFRTALVRNENGRYYVMVVEIERMADFENYLKSEKNKVVEWLSDRS